MSEMFSKPQIIISAATGLKGKVIICILQNVFIYI